MASARLGRGGRRGKASDILLMEPIIVRGLDNAGKGIRGRVFPTASNGAYDKKKKIRVSFQSVAICSRRC